MGCMYNFVPGLGWLTLCTVLFCLDASCDLAAVALTVGACNTTSYVCRSAFASMLPQLPDQTCRDQGLEFRCCRSCITHVAQGWADVVLARRDVSSRGDDAAPACSRKADVTACDYKCVMSLMHTLKWPKMALLVPEKLQILSELQCLSC